MPLTLSLSPKPDDNHSMRRWVLLLLAVATLGTACGGGGSASDDPSGKPSKKPKTPVFDLAPVNIPPGVQPDPAYNSKDPVHVVLRHEDVSDLHSAGTSGHYRPPAYLHLPRAGQAVAARSVFTGRINGQSRTVTSIAMVFDDDDVARKAVIVMRNGYRAYVTSGGGKYTQVPSGGLGESGFAFRAQFGAGSPEPGSVWIAHVWRWSNMVSVVIDSAPASTPASESELSKMVLAQDDRVARAIGG